MKLVWVLLCATILFLFPITISADTTGAVCPDGDVRYNIDTGYEYGDDISFLVSFDAMVIGWHPYETDKSISKICVKLGGPSGGSIIYPDVSTGGYASQTYAISHIVGWLDKPTAVSVSKFSANSVVGFAIGFIIAVVLLTAGFVLLASGIIGKRHVDH